MLWVTQTGGLLAGLRDAWMGACRWRVLCFPNAGSAEDMFSSEGSGSRRVSSPLLVGLPPHVPMLNSPQGT